MKKKLKLLGLSLVFSMTAALGTASAVPILIDVDGVTCYIDGQNQYYYIYMCSDGSLYYLRKNQGGGGGNGGDDDDGGCSPTAIFC
ncbi:hypothetical protein [Marinicella sp. W31]|uniref:hypothetical protein n=1 Tax=Marinicella sp. W31 TaxID=3023713 RepID=UPI0037584600